VSEKTLVEGYAFVTSISLGGPSDDRCLVIGLDIVRAAGIGPVTSEAFLEFDLSRADEVMQWMVSENKLKVAFNVPDDQITDRENFQDESGDPVHVSNLPTKIDGVTDVKLIGY
jgi:hypothetical protein